MTDIKVHAGDFEKHGAFFMFGKFHMYEVGKLKQAIYNADEVDTLEIASEENVKRLGGTVGWGVAGAALLGPVGLLAGLLAGGKRKQVTFVVKFTDGRKLLGTASAKGFTKMQAATF